jgi:hypothetical protein
MRPPPCAVDGTDNSYAVVDRFAPRGDAERDAQRRRNADDDRRQDDPHA